MNQRGPGAEAFSAKWLWQWNNRLFLKNAVKPSQFGEFFLCKNYTSTHTPCPDQLKIWTNKLKQFSYLTYDFSLEREQLPAGGSIFSVHCLKSSVSMCCHFAQVHCKSSFLISAPQLKQNTELFRNKVSSKYSLSQRNKDFRLYEQIFLNKCQQGEREKRQTTSFFLILPTQRLVMFLFALIFTLLTQTLMLQKCKTAMGIKMLSGHINWIAQWVFSSPSISGLSLPLTSFLFWGSGRHGRVCRA